MTGWNETFPNERADLNRPMYGTAEAALWEIREGQFTDAEWKAQEALLNACTQSGRAYDDKEEATTSAQLVAAAIGRAVIVHEFADDDEDGLPGKCLGSFTVNA